VQVFFPKSYVSIIFGCMIQRIQSIFWLAASGTLLFQAYWGYWVKDQNIVLLQIIPILLLLATIFQFNNRKKQIQWSRWSMILTGIFAIVIEVVARNSGDYDNRAWISIPVVPMLFMWLALRAVQKDEAKVRSIDRIR
jgi:peptidoglycan/LPS O-acetylase OafA/YrhL